MKVHSAEFVIGATDRRSLPQDLPEIAVVGRSNVGKSSLLNFLLGRRKLVSFSRTPGKTRQVNYFRINDQFYFVDIPGFGYAKLSKKEHESLLRNIETYFNYSEKIAGVLFLFDIRVTRSPVDEESLEWLTGFDFPILFLATKADKLKKGQIREAMAAFQKNYDLPIPPLPTSSLGKQGRKEVWEQIRELLGPGIST